MRSLEMPNLGKFLIISGLVLITLGLLFYFFSRVPFAGKLPGDIYIEKKKFAFYFPLTTCILLSLFFTLAFWLFSRH